MDKKIEKHPTTNREIKEATVIIAGNHLTFQESMTLRVAINSFLMSLDEENALGDDDHGKRMAAGYRLHARQILNYIHQEAK